LALTSGSLNTTSGILNCDVARALYVTAREQRVVILRAFMKKTEKTPPAEIELALQRAKELKP
jgi:phage-related protein